MVTSGKRSLKNEAKLWDRQIPGVFCCYEVSWPDIWLEWTSRHAFHPSETVWSYITYSWKNRILKIAENAIFTCFQAILSIFLEKMYFLIQLYDSKWALPRIKRDWYDNWEVKQCPSDTKLYLWRISDISSHFNALLILSIGEPKPMTQLSRYGIPYFLRFHMC